MLPVKEIGEAVESGRLWEAETKDEVSRAKLLLHGKSYSSRTLFKLWQLCF